jgi:dTDP-4-dehydrorhamnose 3,5-epimerase
MPPVTEPLPVHGASVTTFDRFGDSRGYFNELYNETKYDESLQQDWKQVSFSQSGKHALRGLHCSPYGKFITCTRGAFYDVIADFREGSPTFGRWCGIMLTEHNRKQVYVPARCGHGFFVFEDNTCALYLQEGTMNPANEADTHPFDPLFNVKWPVPEGVIPLMSAKDTIAPTLAVRRPHLATATPRGRVLIIGGSGQVGAALIEAYGEHNCVGTYCASPVPGMVPFDLSKAGADLQKASAMLSGSPPVAPYPSPLLFSPAPLSTPPPFLPSPPLPESPQISPNLPKSLPNLHKSLPNLPKSLPNLPKSQVEDLITTIYPTVVCICAGWTFVDGCESDPAKANALNNAGPAAVAAVAKKHGAKVVWYSTDYVFDGGASIAGFAPSKGCGPDSETDALHASAHHGASLSPQVRTIQRDRSRRASERVRQLEAGGRGGGARCRSERSRDPDQRRLRTRGSGCALIAAECL